MKKVLLIGNGINQVSDNGASWNALLNKLAGKPKNEREKKVRNAKPFTLWFEELSSTTKKRDLKESVADALKSGIPPNKFHTEIMAMDFQNILTTNYDYNLENATDTGWRPNLAAPESYYSLFRRWSSGSRHIWHVHGELNNTSSIMLGHVQYSGYINKIRNFLTNGIPTEVRSRDKKPYLSKYASKSSRTKGDVENWVDVFLENEVHFVGFGLDYTENHLWNLITEKRRFRKKSRKDFGRAVFHHCSDRKMSTEDEARLSILAALDVRVVDHTASSFPAAYKKCMNTLRNKK